MTGSARAARQRQPSLASFQSIAGFFLVPDHPTLRRQQRDIVDSIDIQMFRNAPVHEDADRPSKPDDSSCRVRDDEKAIDIYVIREWPWASR